MGLLHRQFASLRQRDRSAGIEERLCRNAANELGHWKHHRCRNLLRLQPTRRPVELENARSASMDLPCKCHYISKSASVPY